LAVATRILRNPVEAEDAVQDGLLQAYRGIGKFQGNSSIRYWLKRIVVNAALMRLRSRRRRPEEQLEDTLPELAPDGRGEYPFADWREPLDVTLERSEVRDSVRTAIDRLPKSYRTVLLLRDIEELDTAETARMLETTPGAIKTRLHRARQALRTLLTPSMTKSES